MPSPNPTPLLACMTKLLDGLQWHAGSSACTSTKIDKDNGAFIHSHCNVLILMQASNITALQCWGETTVWNSRMLLGASCNKTGKRKHCGNKAAVPAQAMGVRTSLKAVEPIKLQSNDVAATTPKFQARGAPTMQTLPEILAEPNALHTVCSTSTVGLVSKQGMPQVFCMDPATKT